MTVNIHKTVAFNEFPSSTIQNKNVVRSLTEKLLLLQTNFIIVMYKQIRK